MSRRTRGLAAGPAAKESSTARRVKTALVTTQTLVQVVDIHEKQLAELREFFGMLFNTLQDVATAQEEMDTTLTAVIAVLAKRFGITSEEIERERLRVRALRASQRKDKEQQEVDKVPDLMAGLVQQRQDMKAATASKEYPGAFEFGG